MRDRDGRLVYNGIADSRLTAMLDLAESLLADNAEHVAACCRIEEPGRLVGGRARAPLARRAASRAARRRCS